MMAFIILVFPILEQEGGLETLEVVTFQVCAKKNDKICLSKTTKNTELFREQNLVLLIL